VPDPGAMPPGPPTDWAAIATGGAALGGVLTAAGAALRGARDVRRALRRWLGIDDIAREVRALTPRVEAALDAAQELAHADPRALVALRGELAALRSDLARLARIPGPDDDDRDPDDSDG
jgi:hypothetical protein